MLKPLLGDLKAYKLNCYQLIVLNINLLEDDIPPLTVENLHENTFTFTV